MRDDKDKTIIELLKEMQQQIVFLQTKVNEMQKEHSTDVDHKVTKDKDGSGSIQNQLKDISTLFNAKMFGTLMQVGNRH